jgi:hypothetical protein
MYMNCLRIRKTQFSLEAISGGFAITYRHFRAKHSVGVYKTSTSYETEPVSGACQTKTPNKLTCTFSQLTMWANHQFWLESDAHKVK